MPTTARHECFLADFNLGFAGSCLAPWEPHSCSQHEPQRRQWIRSLQQLPRTDAIAAWLDVKRDKVIPRNHRGAATPLSGWWHVGLGAPPSRCAPSGQPQQCCNFLTQQFLHALAWQTGKVWWRNNAKRLSSGPVAGFANNAVAMRAVLPGRPLKGVEFPWASCPNRH